MKISTTLYFDRATQQMGNVQANLSKVQEQMSTGLQIVKPSDAPDKAALVTRLESELSRQTSYQDTLKAVNVRLTAQETALTNTSDVLHRVKELATQAANDTLSKADRQSVAVELGALREQIMSLGNSQDSNGNYLFSGSRTGVPAFSKDANGHVMYQGDQARMKVNVGDSRRMNLNMPGSDIYTRVVRDDGKGGKLGIVGLLSDLGAGVGGEGANHAHRGALAVELQGELVVPVEVGLFAVLQSDRPAAGEIGRAHV